MLAIAARDDAGAENHSARRADRGADAAHGCRKFRDINRSVLHRDGVAVLLVEQNVPLTLEAGQRIYIIEKGVVRHHAPGRGPAGRRRADPPLHGGVRRRCSGFMQSLGPAADHRRSTASSPA